MSNNYICFWCYSLMFKGDMEASIRLLDKQKGIKEVLKSLATDENVSQRDK